MKVLVEMTDEQYEEYKSRQNESEYLKSKIKTMSINEILEIQGYKRKDMVVVRDPVCHLSTLIIKYKKDSETITREYQSNKELSKIDERYANFGLLKGDEK